jgi:RNA polymerase sigma-70 factor (ECF subfamily)
LRKTTKNQQSEDAQWVLQAKKNRGAFGMLYEKYFDQIYLFIYKRVRDEDLAGDLCQEAMLRAMINIHKYEDRGYPFSAWLYRIASNEVNLYYRKNKKMMTVEVQDSDIQVLMKEISLNNDTTDDQVEQMVAHLNRLKPEQTEIIELRFFMHYSFQQIGDFYQISEATAKMRLYRIVHKLGKMMRKK